MTTGPKGIALIKKFEGLRLKAYRCPAGVWTIGYGHTGPGVVEGLTITREEAERLLLADLARFEKAVSRLVTVPLTQEQFDALVSFCFNVGVNAFRKSTLLRLLNKGKYDEAAEQFKRWVYAGSIVLAGLVRRREAETALFKEKA